MPMKAYDPPTFGHVAGMIMLAITFLFVAAVSASCRGQEIGSAAAVRLQAEMANRALKDEADWNVAKKLSPTPLLGKGKKPLGGETPPDKVAEGESAELHFWEFVVVDIIDARNCTLMLAGKVIWLADYPTAGLASDDKVYLVGKVKNIGTAEYTSLAGQKRVVRKFAFLPKEEIEKEIAARAAEAEAKEWPEWRSTAGTTIKAKFIGGAGGVQLQTKDGRKLLVPLSKFVDEDKEKLRELIKEWRTNKK